MEKSLWWIQETLDHFCVVLMLWVVWHLDLITCEVQTVCSWCLGPAITTYLYTIILWREPSRSSLLCTAVMMQNTSIWFGQVEGGFAGWVCTSNVELTVCVNKCRYGVSGDGRQDVGNYSQHCHDCHWDNCNSISSSNTRQRQASGEGELQIRGNDSNPLWLIWFTIGLISSLLICNDSDRSRYTFSNWNSFPYWCCLFNIHDELIYLDSYNWGQFTTFSQLQSPPVSTNDPYIANVDSGDNPTDLKQ